MENLIEINPKIMVGKARDKRHPNHRRIGPKKTCIW